MRPRILRRIFILVLVTFLLALPALAIVDLVSPEDGASMNAQNITFEYYPSMSAVDSCTLNIDTNNVQDYSIQNNAFNTFTIVNSFANIGIGDHTWRITCQNGTDTEYSVMRNLNLDEEAPDVTILSPTNGGTLTQSKVRLVATDNDSPTIDCDFITNESYDTATLENGVESTVNLSLEEEGTHQLVVTCADAAGNLRNVTTNFTLDLPSPNLYLNLSLSKTEYALGEPIYLTIDTIDEANLGLEVCPNKQGFVQCYSPLIEGSFPQTVTLPYTNTSGDYIIEGTAISENRSVIQTAEYRVENTMRVLFDTDKRPKIENDFTLSASTVGAIGDVSYIWALSNGSMATGSSVTLTYEKPGTFVERVIATDSAGNAVNASYKTELLPDYDITVLVKDSDSGKLLDDAEVQLQKKGSGDSVTKDTSAEGEVVIPLTPDTYKLFVTRSGYAYYYHEVEIEKEQTLTVLLDRNDNEKPVITLLSPESGAKVTPPVTVAFTVKDDGEVTCSLSYAKADDDWMQLAGTLAVKDKKEHSFRLDALEEQQYTYRIECEDTNGNLGKSEQGLFTVAAEDNKTKKLLDAYSDDPLTVIDKAYGAYDSFTADQRKVADLLHWEDLLKEKKLAIERAERDINSLKFRKDLDDEEKQAQMADFNTKISEAQSVVPVDLVVTEKKSMVNYIKDDELQRLAQAVIDEKEYAFTTEQVVAYLKQVQQEFAQQTDLYRATMVMPDGTEKRIGLVTHAFRYTIDGKDTASLPEGDVKSFVDALGGTYTLLEAVPEGMAVKGKELNSENERKVLSESPLLVEFAPDSRITYYVEKDISLSTLSDARTLLLKRPSADDMSSITGKVLTMRIFDWKLSIILTILLAISIFLLRRVNLLHHIKYLFYAESGKKGMHAVKLLINDGRVHLESGELDQAMMRYKEAKLSYENLTNYAKNECYDELILFKRLLDKGYFDLLTERIADAIRRGDFAAAVDDYARLEKTFTMLEPEERESVIMIATELAKRLGLGGAA